MTGVVPGSEEPTTRAARGHGAVLRAGVQGRDGRGAQGDLPAHLLGRAAPGRRGPQRAHAPQREDGAAVLGARQPARADRARRRRQHRRGDGPQGRGDGRHAGDAEGADHPRAHRHLRAGDLARHRAQDAGGEGEARLRAEEAGRRGSDVPRRRGRRDRADDHPRHGRAAPRHHRRPAAARVRRRRERRPPAGRLPRDAGQAGRRRGALRTRRRGRDAVRPRARPRRAARAPRRQRAADAGRAAGAAAGRAKIPETPQAILDAAMEGAREAMRSGPQGYPIEDIEVAITGDRVPPRGVDADRAEGGGRRGAAPGLARGRHAPARADHGGRDHLPGGERRRRAGRSERAPRPDRRRRLPRPAARRSAPRCRCAACSATRPTCAARPRAAPTTRCSSTATTRGSRSYCPC